MKTNATKLRLIVLVLALLSISCGYLAMFSPGTVIQYEVIVNANQSNQKSITQEGFSHFGDKSGVDAISCSYPRFQKFSGSLETGFRIWQWIGTVLGYAPFFVGVSFLPRSAAQQKMSLLRFFLLLLIVFGGPVAMLFILTPRSLPLCDSANLYKLISFMPYWPIIPVLLIGIFSFVWCSILHNRLNSQEGNIKVS